MAEDIDKIIDAFQELGSALLGFSDFITLHDKDGSHNAADFEDRRGNSVLPISIPCTTRSKFKPCTLGMLTLNYPWKGAHACNLNQQPASCCKPTNTAWAHVHCTDDTNRCWLRSFKTTINPWNWNTTQWILSKKRRDEKKENLSLPPPSINDTSLEAPGELAVLPNASRLLTSSCVLPGVSLPVDEPVVFLLVSGHTRHLLARLGIMWSEQRRSLFDISSNTQRKHQQYHSQE